MANGIFFNGTTNTVEVTGSLNASYGITGSLLGTATNAVTATAATTAQTASSVASNLTQSINLQGNLRVDGTGSFTYLHTVYETASVIYSSGSNTFGDDVSDLQQFTGSVTVSGSLKVNGITIPQTLPEVTTYLSSSWTGSVFQVNSGSWNTSISNLNTSMSLATSSVSGIATSASNAYVSSSIVGSTISYFKNNGVIDTVTVAGGSTPSLQTVTTVGNQTTAGISITGSLANGSNILPTGSYSHAEGSGSISIGIGSHAEGLGDFMPDFALSTTSTNLFYDAYGYYFTGVVWNSLSQIVVDGDWSGIHPTPFGNPIVLENTGLGKSVEVNFSPEINTTSVSYNSGLDRTTISFDQSFNSTYPVAATYGNKAIGNYSHVEGFNTTAIGITSHAEGTKTTSVGFSSHAEGTSSIAAADYSHAEGRETVANALGSHAEGYGTFTSADYQHAEGKFNEVNGDAIWIVGDGVSNGTRHNLITSYPSTDGITPDGRVTITGSLFISQSGVAGDNLMHIIPGPNITITSGSTGYVISASAATPPTPSLQDVTTVGNQTTQPVYITGSLTNGNGVLTTGNYSHAEGTYTKAIGDYSHAEGSQTTTGGNYSHAEGNMTTATGTNSHAEGEYTVASGDYSHAEGEATTANTYAAHAEGYLTTAMNQYAHAEGYWTTAMGYGSHTEGINTVTRVDYSHAEGEETTAAGRASHAEGHLTTSATPYTHAEGLSTIAGNRGSHAEGSGSYSLGIFSHAEGRQTVSQGSGSHSEGWGTLASDPYSHTEGSGSIAFGTGSHAEGKGTMTAANYQHAEGWFNIADPNAIWMLGNGTSNSSRSNLVAAYTDRLVVTGSIIVSGSGAANGAVTVIPAPGSAGLYVSDVGTKVAIDLQGGTSGQGSQAAINGDIIFQGGLFDFGTSPSTTVYMGYDHNIGTEVGLKYDGNLSTLTIENNSVPIKTLMDTTKFQITDGVVDTFKVESVSGVATMDLPSGTINAGTKNFKINHPVTSMSASHWLLHSCIEGPEALLIYDGPVEVINGTGSVNLDTYFRMTAGTFEALTKEARVMVTNNTTWDQVKGEINGATVTVYAKDSASVSEVRWLVLAERNDITFRNSNTTDENGDLILEVAK